MKAQWHEEVLRGGRKEQEDQRAARGWSPFQHSRICSHVEKRFRKPLPWKVWESPAPKLPPFTDWSPSSLWHQAKRPSGEKLIQTNLWGLCFSKVPKGIEGRNPCSYYKDELALNIRIPRWAAELMFLIPFNLKSNEKSWKVLAEKSSSSVHLLPAELCTLWKSWGWCCRPRNLFSSCFQHTNPMAVWRHLKAAERG